MGFCNLKCCSHCCLVFSAIGVLFLIFFGVLIKVENVSFEEVWEQNYFDVEKAREEKVRKRVVVRPTLVMVVLCRGMRFCQWVDAACGLNYPRAVLTCVVVGML
eukprot:TRINITY_DN2628_c0_g1_i2.p4 TRINITY_DN2628_c0_g1~~TRINITY_DN2628_c0_g1_i2.p4  ORF type:complete len:104 (+),score=7.36 TRINITY_DN2628_c0_g1_i2:212-523(+)